MQSIESSHTDLPDLDYQVLTGFWRNGDVVSDAQLRREYIRHTERLINRIVSQQPDNIIFLDKSARPVAWMVREFWQDFAPVGSKMPQFHFLNIDREQWRDEVTGEGGMISLDRLSPARVNELRALFSTKPVQDNLAGEVSEKVKDSSTVLDGKRIMIVDEVKATGDTLAIAKKMIRHAFPAAEDVNGVYWLPPISRQIAGGGQVTNEVPVWYKQTTQTGRGVGNRDVITSARSGSRLQRIGRWFLSTKLTEKDESSDQLRNEIRQLALEYRVGKTAIRT